MRITAELSLYPMRGDAVAKILSFIENVADPRLELEVNQMSTQIRGELRDVLAVLERALERSFASGVPEVLVAKFLNADLPIRESPDLESR
jgi:uncharacterized protein YqgV (UPF0045/DUF77 family)